MTIRDMYRYKDLRVAIASIEEELNEISVLKAVDYSGVRVKSGGTGDPVASLAEQREKLVDKLNRKKIEAQRQIIMIEQFIDTIPNTEVQEMMREHFILLHTYAEIGDARHYDRTTVSKKIRAYL